MKLIILCMLAAISAVKATAQNINNSNPTKNNIKTTGVKPTSLQI
jgi:hypothetical protein